MSFNTRQQILTALSNVLKFGGESDLPEYYSAAGGLIDQALTASYYEVLGRLLRRGFRLNEEVLLFDRAAEFEADIAVYWCLQRSGAYGSVDQRTLQALDRREELDTVLVFVDGVWAQPASGQPGTAVTGGPMAQDPGAVFNYDPAGDPFDQGIRW